jgi:hypothetical protein
MLNLTDMRLRRKFDREFRNFHGAGLKLRAGARFVSRSFSEGWCPGETTITNLSWVKKQKLRRVATKSRPGRAKSLTSPLIIPSEL